MKITKRQLAKIIKEEKARILSEDGHTDVSSATRAMQTIIEDAVDMLGELRQMNSGDHLPTWWTNKMAVSAEYLNKLRDYLLIKSEPR